MKVTALVAVLAVAPGASAATRSRCSSKLSAQQVTTGQPALLTGTVTPHRARAVRLQLRQAGRWRTAARTRSTKRGAFSFTLPTATAQALTIRAVAPRAGRSQPATCRARTLTIVAAGSGGQVDAGPAFLAVYALASDQAEDPGKVGAIRGTIEAVDGWFATQTTGGVVPRWARATDGTIDVAIVRLGHSVADYAAAADSFGLIKSDLEANGLPAAGGQQKLGVFIDVTNRDACAANQDDVTIVMEAACNIHPDAEAAWPYGATYVFAHELTHNFGAVESCAPHSDGTGHVADDRRDVLYNGPEDRDWEHLMLDPGHDDYYATGRSDCPGIDASPFWAEAR